MAAPYDTSGVLKGICTRAKLNNDVRIKIENKPYADARQALRAASISFPFSFMPVNKKMVATFKLLMETTSFFGMSREYAIPGAGKKYPKVKAVEKKMGR